MDDLTEVVRVETEHGSHIEPPHDTSWDELTSLRWKAAVVMLSCPDLTIKVHPATGNQFGLVVGGTSSAYCYTDAWLSLNAVEIGWREARRG